MLEFAQGQGELLDGDQHVAEDQSVWELGHVFNSRVGFGLEGWSEAEQGVLDVGLVVHGVIKFKLLGKASFFSIFCLVQFQSQNTIKVKFMVLDIFFLFFSYLIKI